MKTILSLIIGVFFLFAVFVNVYALSSIDATSDEPDTRPQWEEGLLCDSGSTYKECYMSGDDGACSPLNATVPDPKCPK